MLADGVWAEPWEVHVRFAQPADPQRLVDYVASMSWVAAMSDGDRAAMLEHAERIVRSGETPAQTWVRLIIGLTKLV